MRLADAIVDTRLRLFDSDEPTAELALYTPQGDSPVGVTIIRGQTDTSLMIDAPPGDSMDIIVLMSEVPSPKKGGVFTIDSEAWSIVSNNGGDNFAGTWGLSLSRSGRRMA